MPQRWRGPVLVLLILGAVTVFLALNLDLKGTGPRSRDLSEGIDPAASAGSSPATQPTGAAAARPAGFREYPIGDEVERNQMRIAAVWLPPIQMDGMPGPGSSDLIHIEADIHATEGNKNGCPRDEFVPYLDVEYAIVPRGETARSAEPIRGPMIPMVARDGWHYGASIAMPGAGRYKVTYSIKPPTAPVGRHSDPATGVAPWWKPFEVSFDWDYPGISH